MFFVFIFRITATSFSDLEIKLKFKLKQYLNYFWTDYRSTSTQASAPEEPKVDKGMESASIIIHYISLIISSHALNLFLLLQHVIVCVCFSEKFRMLLDNLWACVEPQQPHSENRLLLPGEASSRSLV